jgi:hypothetical protein
MHVEKVKKTSAMLPPAPNKANIEQLSSHSMTQKDKGERTPLKVQFYCLAFYLWDLIWVVLSIRRLTEYSLNF